MANEEHLGIIKKGVELWNDWREKNEGFTIDLSGASLSGANLFGANLSGVNLYGADLSGANLWGSNLYGASLWGAKLQDSNISYTNLSGANLSGADLTTAKLWHSTLLGADLSDANLREANLSGANISEANLRRVILIRANLNKANLSHSDLQEADLSEAFLSETNFLRAILDNANFNSSVLAFTIFSHNDLSTCQGLDYTVVNTSCSIDFQTLRASKNLPKSFLLKIGLPEHYIDYLPDFYGNSFLFPAFLSHSWKNKPFVRNLYEALIGKGVNVFLDEKKMKPGDDLYESITKGIQDYDKMILVCSKESLTESWWVDRELDRVFAKERELFKKHEKRINLLIPIRIDDYIFEWKGAKAEEVRRYIIGDFRPEADFEKSLNDLVHALHVERPDVKPPSFL